MNSPGMMIRVMVWCKDVGEDDQIDDKVVVVPKVPVPVINGA